MKIHQLSAGDAVASLNSSPKGLSPGEAQRRLVEYGPNRVEEIHRESPVLRFVKEFVHFFALILWLAAALAFLAEWIDPGQGMAKIAGKPPYQALTLFARAGALRLPREFRVLGFGLLVSAVSPLQIFSTTACDAHHCSAQLARIRKKRWAILRRADAAKRRIPPL